MAGQPVAASFRCVVVPRVFRAPEGSAAARPALMGLAAVCAGGRRPASLMVLLVAPRVFRAPEGPAAREARRPHFVRCRASKPARALRSLRRPPHRWCCVAGVWLGASAQSLARPRRRPRALQSGPPVPPAPSTPVGPGVLTFVTSAAHWSSGQAPPPPTGTAVWPSGPSGSLHTGGAVSLECGWGRVVKNVVNPRCFLCGFLIRCYKRRQSEGFFADYGGFWAWIDDVCHRGLREAI